MDFHQNSLSSLLTNKGNIGKDFQAACYQGKKPIDREITKKTCKYFGASKK